MKNLKLSQCVMRGKISKLCQMDNKIILCRKKVYEKPRKWKNAHTINNNDYLTKKLNENFCGFLKVARPLAIIKRQPNKNFYNIQISIVQQIFSIKCKTTWNESMMLQIFSSS